MRIPQDAEKVSRQFLKFAVVVIASNVVLYALYLLMTSLGVEHKVALTLLYALGILQTFVFNKRWSFGYQGAAGPALLRYVIAYASGYILNMSVLVLLVDRAGYAHQLIQGIMILVMVVLAFLIQKLWVFGSIVPDSR
jgi:putative flippase GtrA